MSGTLTVKELIKELLECDLDAAVHVRTGLSNRPSSGAFISVLYKGVEDVVFIVTHDHLERQPS